MTAPAPSPEILVTGPGGRVPVPRWARDFTTRVATEVETRSLSTLPELTVVRFKSVQQAFESRGLLSYLGHLQHHAAKPARVMLMFAQRTKLDLAPRLTELLGLFPEHSLVDVTFHERNQTPLRVFETLAKIRLDVEMLLSERDVLGRDASIAAATRDLHAPSGRLSARRTAAVFGLTTAEIARLSGLSRQAISKTDDSPAAQETLRSLERIARLRARLEDDEFRRWLRTPRAELDGSAPLDSIRAGRSDAIAEWVEGLLVGNPA